MSIRPIDKFIQPNDRVTVTDMGNIVELQYMEKWVVLQSLKKARLLQFSLGSLSSLK